MDPRMHPAGSPSDPGAPDGWRELAIAWRNRAVLLFDRLPLPIAFCDADATVVLANPAMAAEWGVLPGQLAGRNALDLFRPRTRTELHPIAEAVRLRRMSRYPVEVSWSAAGGAERHGELTVDLVGDRPGTRPDLLLVLRVLPEPAEPPGGRPGTAGQVSAIEARILALAAGGSTTAQIARAVGLTADGVKYHLGRLSRRWGAANRTALVAYAYVHGVLAPGTWPPAPAAGAGRGGE